MPHPNPSTPKISRPPGVWLDRKSILWTLALALLAWIFIYPFLWMLLSAFKDNVEIFQPRQFWPAHFDTRYLTQLLDHTWIPFIHVLLNSLVIALVQSAGAVLLTSMAGYAFGRHQFPGHRWLFVGCVLVIAIPSQALAIPMFTWLHAIGLHDRLAGVILPGMVSGLGVLYFTQVFRQFPAEWIDLARVEGASEPRIYWTLLPLARPALLSFGLVHFILAWHEHLIPLLILNTTSNQTLPLALSSLYGSSLRFPYAVLMAGSAFAILPTALLFALLQRRFKTALANLLVH